MNTIRAGFQPLMAFFTKHVWRSLNALQTKTKGVALPLLMGLTAYLTYRLCLKDRVIRFLSSEKIDKLSVCYQGHEDASEKMSEQRLRELVRELKVYMADPKHRKDDLGRPNTSLVRVPNQFQFLEEPHLDAFMRFLVLEEVGVAYREAKGGYCLYLEEEAIAQDTSNETSTYPHYTKQKLLDVNRQLQALTFPDMEKYSPQLQSTVRGIFDSIKLAYYHRFNDNEPVLCRTLARISTPGMLQVMDQLVCEYPDLVYAWNACAQTGDKDPKVILKLKKDDPVDDSAKGSFIRGSTWRDRALIEKETAFRKNNQISISTPAVESSSLSNTERIVLNTLVERLNKREKPGTYLWNVSLINEMMPVLQFLREQGVIYAYQRVQNGFHIWVKVEDLDKMQLCYLGCESSFTRLDEGVFQAMMKQFDTYKTNSANRKKALNQPHDGCVFITKDFTQNIPTKDEGIFVYYLFLQQEAVAYYRHSSGLVLFLNEEAVASEKGRSGPRLITKQEWIKACSDVLALPFPPLTSCSESERSRILEPVLNEIQRAYHRRFLFDERVVAEIRGFGPSSLILTKFLDQLIEQSPPLIDAWAYQDATLFIRLKPEDEIESGVQISWRTKTEIDAEKAFKAANRIDLTGVDVSSLNEDEQAELRKVVEELNQRVQHGPYSLAETSTRKVVFEFLKERKLILSYESYYDLQRFFECQRTICCVKEGDRAIYQEQLDEKRKIEEAFQVANRIEVTPELLQENDLDNEQKELLQTLVKALNTRGKPGAYYHSVSLTSNPYDCRLVLKFLKNKGLIHEYKEKLNSFGGSGFRIYVKKSDKSK